MLLQTSYFTLLNLLNVFVGLVWLVNGLFCKVLDWVPRHRQIVERILGIAYSNLVTKCIGISEVFMFVWVISKIQMQWCAICQIILVTVMNVIEFYKSPDLLLFGKRNIIVAFLFIVVVYINGFLLANSVV